MRDTPKEHQSTALPIRSWMEEQQQKMTTRKVLEKCIPYALKGITALSIFTTLLIIITLLTETITFFKHVPFLDFFTGTILKPLSQEPAFGIVPLVVGTLTSTVIAMIVAVPIGLMTAIYLSEYASENRRKTMKPLLEVLAGIPTIVYGFFAFTFVTPLLQKVIPSLETTNILSPGIVMGIMIIPMIASLSEDAMHAVPTSMRDGALALGATKLEVTWRVILPASLSGIISSIVLAISRAIGETMIVTIASGSSKQLTFDITQSMQTMTAYIVEVTSGDAAAGSTIYYSLYAVAMTLFVFTFLMNMCAKYIAKRFREDY